MSNEKDFRMSENGEKILEIDDKDCYFIDIDGTIVDMLTWETLESNSKIDNFIQELLPGVKEFFENAEKSNHTKEHQPIPCQGFTNKKKPCPSKRVISAEIPYCDAHKNQAPKVEVPKATITGSIKCQGLTKKKKPCKGKSVTGYKFCPDHMSQYDEIKSSANHIIEFDDSAWYPEMQTNISTAKTEEYAADPLQSSKNAETANQNFDDGNLEEHEFLDE